MKCPNCHDRKHIDVEIAGKQRRMAVKYGWIHGEIYSLKPEFDQALEWATELGIPVREVLRAIEHAGWKSVKKNNSIPGGR